MTTQIEIRPGSESDLAEIAWLDGVAFGMQYTDQDLQDLIDAGRPEFLVATEAGRIVGVTADWRFTMTLPGGGALDVPGVTWVSVDPARRRRGILRALMDHQLAAYTVAGEPAAILTASEGGIYRRFGYGPATELRTTVIDRRSARLREPVDTGDVRVVSAETARHLLPELHRRWRTQVPGALSRTEPLWNKHFLDREAQRDGRSARFYLVHPDGYLVYRVTTNWNDGRPAHGCSVVDSGIATDQAEVALWQVLLGMDLFGEIETSELTTDSPVPHLLTNARHARTTAITDGLWLRPLDVPALLSARRYAVEFEAVLEVVGVGRFALVGDGETASCEPTGRAADVVLDRAALGSIYLGGRRLRTLVRAGLAGAPDDRVLRRVDAAFGTDRAPAHGTAF